MKVMKSIGATILSLCMLCALLLGVTVLPAAAAEVSAKLPVAFDVDFGELAKVASKDGAYDASGLYDPDYDDDYINAWVNDRFNIYLGKEAQATTPQLMYLGQSSYNFVADTTENTDWGGEHKWLINKNGYLQYDAEKVPYDTVRKGQQLAVKTADGALAQMENFEATMVFNTLGNDKGGVAISFHEKAASRVADSGTAAYSNSNVVYIMNDNARGGFTTSADAAVVRASGKTVWKPLHATSYGNGILLKDMFGEGKNLVKNTDYKLTVRVVNRQVDITVTDMEGTVMYEGSVTLETSCLGTVSFGVFDSDRAIKSISVKEMDENGEVVDFGTHTTNKKTFTFNADGLLKFAYGGDGKQGGKYFGSTKNGSDSNNLYTYDGNIKAETIAEIMYLLRSKFKEYRNLDDSYLETDFNADLSDDKGGFWSLYNGQWVTRLARRVQGTGNMRLISSLVPLDEHTGAEIQASDFEATYTVRFETAAAGGAAVFGFRQVIPGKFTTDVKALVKEQAFVSITPTGISFGAGAEQITDTADDNMYDGDSFYSFADGGYTTANYQEFTITVKAEGDKAYLKIVDKNNTVVFNNFAGGKNEALVMDISGAPEKGYIAYGIGESQMGVGSVQLTVLDDGPATFDVNFGGLAKIVPKDGAYDASGLYDPDYDDEHINTWVNDRFNIYLGKEAQATTPQLMYLGQSSYNFIADTTEKTDWGGEHKWLINKNGYLQYDAETNAGETVRKGQQLAVKTADGALAQMENFEATMVFNTKDNARGGVAISFHEKAASRVTDMKVAQYSNSNVVYIMHDSVGDAAVVRASGKSVGHPLHTTESHHGDGILLKDMFGDGKNLVKNTDYKLTVRVVNRQVDIKVTDMKGTVMYEGSKVLETSYLGTVSFGVFDSDRAIKSISVKEMDENGEVVDFGTHTTNRKTFTFNTDGLLQRTNGAQENTYIGVTGNGGDANALYTYDSTANAEKVAQVKYLLRSKFKEYHDAVGNYLETDFEVVPTAGTAFGSNSKRDNAGFWALFNGLWLQRVYQNLQHRENMRLISSLVPLDEHTGEEIQASDFEATYTVRFENAAEGGSAVFGFRQAIPGKFTTGAYALVQEQAFITITPTGISFGAGPKQIPFGVDKSLNNLYNSDAFYSFADGDYLAGEYQEFTITVRAEGYNAYLKIVDKNGNVAFNNFAGGAQEKFVMDISGAPEKGYIAYGVGESKVGISSVQLTVLDGQAVKNGDIVVDSTMKDGVYTNTITVTPDEGYELLAGSLIAVDVNGRKYAPTRVGFRENGDASQYVVQCASPVRVTATFYQPTMANPNVGNIGTSINEELAGLRFVSRLNRTVNDGTEYVTLDGETFEVSDYGMLVAVKSVLGTDDLTLDVTETNEYVKRLSVKERQIYYDACDQYVDMSVCITGVDKVIGGVDMEVVARPYAIAKDENGEDVILYARSFTSTYAENAGLTVATFSKLEKDGNVTVLG